MIYGPKDRLDPTQDAAALTAGSLVLAAHPAFDVPPERSRVGSIIVWADGLAPGGAQQWLRGVVRSPSGWVAGAPVAVAGGDPAGWVHLPFPAPPVVPQDGAPFMGVWAGSGNSVRVGLDPAASGDIETWAAPFSLSLPPSPADPAVTSSGQLAAVAFYARPYPWQRLQLTDAQLSGLPFPIAQEQLSYGVSPTGTPAVAATCGWHGTSVDEVKGSVGIVRTGGPLADLVGERVRITVTESGRSVVAYLHDEQDFGENADEDVSVTQRLGLALGVLSASSWGVHVEVLA